MKTPSTHGSGHSLADTMKNQMVMVVDDSPDTLSLLNQTLEQAGLSVLVALSGHQAIAIAQKIVPDMILMDAMMPGLDGFETCKRLKANPQLSDIPVIFMTGLDDTPSTVKGLEAGGVDYLTKPVNPDELIARMRVHLTNAKRTFSAHTALDTTGQHLFNINTEFQIVWATPQTKQLFAKAQPSQHWMDISLPKQLKAWIAMKPNPGQLLSLRGLPHKLKIRLIEHTENNEMLLRLIDGMAPVAADKLKQVLPLTGRESEVLYWIGNGKSNLEIGQILAISPRTINKHLEQIFRKLDVVNRTSAAAIAIRVLAAD